MEKSVSSLHCLSSISTIVLCHKRPRNDSFSRYNNIYTIERPNRVNWLLLSEDTMTWLSSTVTMKFRPIYCWWCCCLYLFSLSGFGMNVVKNKKCYKWSWQKQRELRWGKVVTNMFFRDNFSSQEGRLRGKEIRFLFTFLWSRILPSDSMSY